MSCYVLPWRQLGQCSPRTTQSHGSPCRYRHSSHRCVRHTHTHRQANDAHTYTYNARHRTHALVCTDGGLHVCQVILRGISASGRIQPDSLPAQRTRRRSFLDNLTGVGSSSGRRMSWVGLGGGGSAVDPGTLAGPAAGAVLVLRGLRVRWVTHTHTHTHTHVCARMSHVSEVSCIARVYGLPYLRVCVCVCVCVCHVTGWVSTPV